MWVVGWCRPPARATAHHRRRGCCYVVVVVVVVLMRGRSFRGRGLHAEVRDARACLSAVAPPDRHKCRAGQVDGLAGGLDAGRRLRVYSLVGTERKAHCCHFWCLLSTPRTHSAQHWRMMTSRLLPP